MTDVAARRTYDLTYRAAGEGVPLVLLHAFPIDGRLYDAQLSAAETGRIRARLIAVDLPGFGRTRLPEPVPDVLRAEDMAGSLAALIERESLGPVVVGGVAIGGYSAIELAARYPELVRGLVLIGCKAAPDSPKMAPQREEVAQRALRAGARAIADELHALPLGPQADAAVRDKMRTMIESADPRAIAALVRGIAARPDPAPVLPGLDVPALVIAGERDPFSPLEVARRVAELLPNAEFVMIDGVGHMAPLEAPINVSRALASFIRRLASDH